MEYHLFIIWEKAQWKKDDIVADIQKDLQIIKCVDITWEKSRFADNLSRFYGKKLPSGSLKEQECGNGMFTLVVVVDLNPQYEERPTSHGKELVNINIFDRKERFREWTNDETTPKNYHGSRIHGTNNERETKHDLTLLLGVSPEDLAQNPDVIPDEWNKNVLGLNGWNNLKELFYLLNQSVNYLVLRNFEYLPMQYSSSLHGDIDILVDDYDMAVSVLGGEKVFKSRFRVHYVLNVNGEKVFFDVRFVGDRYYCTKWEQHMLDKKEVLDAGINVMCAEDFKYSLLYHALIHKKQISIDYREKLQLMFSNDDTIWNKELKSYLDEKGYTFTYPKDLSVNWNSINSGKKFQITRRIYGLIGRIKLVLFSREQK